MRSAQSDDLVCCLEFKSDLVSRLDSDAGFQSQEKIVFLALTGKRQTHCFLSRSWGQRLPLPPHRVVLRTE